MKWDKEDQPLPWDDPEADPVEDLRQFAEKSRTRYYSSAYWRYES